MCGIAGIVRWDPPVCRPGEIERMTRTVAHRGPDGEGVWASAGIALGHRRLAIIDLESGGQPMTNEDGTILLTFNGEIYNYRELRSDLCRRGHHFATQSDTEVIVHAYEEWGADCVERFRGMFAFGIADMRRRRLFLARDPFGIKPLYLCRDGDELAFASELRSLRAGGFPEAPRLDLLQLRHYLAYGYLSPEGAPFESVESLPPAMLLTIDTEGRERRSTYWSPPKPGESHTVPGQIADHMREVLESSVGRQLVADVPVGVFLSGGLDSSTVSALARRKVSGALQTFRSASRARMPFPNSLRRERSRVTSKAITTC